MIKMSLKNIFALVAGLGICASTMASEAKYVKGELIVKFNESKSLYLTNKLQTYDVAFEREIRLSSQTLHILKYDQKRDIKEVIYALKSFGEIEYIEPNYIYSIVKPISEEEIFVSNLHKKNQNYTPSDRLFSKLWGLHNTGSNSANGVAGADLNMLKAWDVEEGSKDVLIAVIDTGIDYNHPDLKDQMWINEAEANGTEGVDDDGNGYIDDIHGYDFANNDSDPIDGHSHGTHCAGTIGASHNDIGVAGVMKNVSFVAVKFLTDRGSGTTEGAIKSIDYATTLNVDLMSNSWGGGGKSQALEDAIRRASEKGIVFTAAAGNSSTDNDSKPHYPSNYDVENVISVAATTSADTLASFSCYGANTVHIAAPGHKILSTVKNGKYKVYSGTSMATPHVSGALGLLISHLGRLPHEELRERLLATSIPLSSLRGKTINHGRLDAYNLLTNTIPERSMPKPGEWVEVALENVFESQHPYRNSGSANRTLIAPGAKFIRVKVRRYSLERNYDFLFIKDKNGATISKLSGQGRDYTSGYLEGDSVTLEFSSDKSISKWGYLVESFEVQY